MQDNNPLNAIVNRLVHSTDPDEVKSVYKEWAATYDSDLDGFGYIAPRIGVGLLAEHLSNKQSLIHDAGCGTGLVGALLHQHGYKRLHGSDFSTDMLQKAESTGCYGSLQNLDFSEPLDIDSGVYDAVISIGVYTKRFNIHFLPEMLRTLKPSGCMVFSCRELYFDEVMASVSAMFKAGVIVSVSIRLDDYMTGQDASAYYVHLVKSH